MSTPIDPQANGTKNAFETAAEEKRVTLANELVVFILENKAWWMIPIIAVLSLVALFVALASTGAAPFIYTLF